MICHLENEIFHSARINLTVVKIFFSHRAQGDNCGLR